MRIGQTRQWYSAFVSINSAGVIFSIALFIFIGYDIIHMTREYQRDKEPLENSKEALMMRGRKSALRVELTLEQVTVLQTLARQRRLSNGLARRVRAMLLLAEGHLSITQIAARVGVSRRHIYKWAQRFHVEGLAGLRDQRCWQGGITDVREV
jgi:CRP-like cAMP-binding protein